MIRPSAGIIVPFEILLALKLSRVKSSVLILLRAVGRHQEQPGEPQFPEVDRFEERLL